MGLARIREVVTMSRELDQLDELSRLQLMRALAEQRGQHTAKDLEALDPRGELKLELLDGWLYLNPPPSHEHEHDVERVLRLMVPLIPADLRFSTNFHVQGAGIKNFLIPDFAIADPAHMHGHDIVEIQGLALAVEVTSPYNRANDTDIKLSIYREHRVPYLLIDEAGTGRWHFLGDNWPTWANPLRDYTVTAGVIHNQDWTILSDNTQDRRERG
jgi:Uma2 family endonuclease